MNAAAEESLPVYDSARRGPPALEELQEVVRYWDLVVQLVRRNLTSRYKRSALGIAWTMLNPLMNMAILALVFSQIFRFALENYIVYLLAGLIFWNFFSQTTIFAMNELVWGGGLLARIYLPPATFVVAALGTGLVNLLLSLVPLLVVMVVTGAPLTGSLLFAPVAIVIGAMFALGISFLVSTLALYFADVADMYQILLLAWMYLTPIIYPKEIIPESYRWVVTNINPMYHLVEVFRSPFVNGWMAGYKTLGLAAGIALVTLVVGWYVFSRQSSEFAYRV
jgi:ABC-type polysaccharide/polyol phosphate export permease